MNDYIINFQYYELVNNNIVMNDDETDKFNESTKPNTKRICDNTRKNFSKEILYDDIEFDTGSDYEESEDCSSESIDLNDNINKITSTKSKIINKSKNVSSNGIKRYICDICNKIYISKSILETHKSESHKNHRKIVNNNIKKFTCDVCYRIFLSQSILVTLESLKALIPRC